MLRDDVAKPYRFEGSGRDEVEKNLNAAQKVEMVVDLLRGLGRRHAVHEVEHSDSGLDLVGRHDLVGDLVVKARRRIGAGFWHLRIRQVRKRDARKGRCRQQRAPAKHNVAAVDFIEVIERTGLVVLIRSVVAHRDRLLRLTGISEWLCAAPISLHLSQDKVLINRDCPAIAD